MKKSLTKIMMALIVAGGLAVGSTTPAFGACGDQSCTTWGEWDWWNGKWVFYWF